MKTKSIDELSDTVELLPAKSRKASFRGTRTAYQILLPAAVLLLAISVFMGRSAEARQAATPSSSAPAGTQKITQIVMPVSLTTSLDSKNQKIGAEVIGKVGGTVKLKDGTTIPRGAKIIGHVTEAKARSGGDPESSLTIAFDTINLSGGKTLAIKASVQAVGPDPNEDSGGGVDYGTTSINQTMEHAQASTTVSSPVTILTEQSVGVYGIKNLELGADGVLKSNDKSVKLAGRSQIVLRAQVALTN